MLYKCLHDYYAVIICKKDVLKFLKLGEGVKELSRWDRQSKKQDLRFMATTEVFHKPAGVRSSSKITDSFVASFPGLPHIITFSIHGTFETNSASLGNLSKSGKGFSGVHRFSATNSRAACSLDIYCTLQSDRNKAFFSFPVWVCESRVHESSLHFTLGWSNYRYRYASTLPTKRIWLWISYYYPWFGTGNVMFPWKGGGGIENI